MTQVSRTSCIQHPANNRFSMLRQEYWQICATNELSHPARACAAKLLNIFEQWMNSKLANRTQAQRSNKAALQSDCEATHDEGLWVYESAESLAESLIDEHPVKTVRQSLGWLVSIGYLRRRRNPEYKWDKTYQYQIDVDAVQQAIARSLDFVELPYREHHDSPQATSSVPTGNSNTIDSNLDSTKDSLSRLRAVAESADQSHNSQKNDNDAAFDSAIAPSPARDNDSPASLTLAAKEVMEVNSVIRGRIRSASPDAVKVALDEVREAVAVGLCKNPAGLFIATLNRLEGVAVEPKTKQTLPSVKPRQKSIKVPSVGRLKLGRSLDVIAAELLPSGFREYSTEPSTKNGETVHSFTKDWSEYVHLAVEDASAIAVDGEYYSG